jgi:hypothetical protein
VSQSKIFGIGLSRTGTTSLTLALEILGFSVIHFPRIAKQIEDHDAATDTSVAASFETLDGRFPGSRFIYTTRDLDEWLESCRRFWAKRQSVQFDKDLFITNLHCQLYGGADFDPERFAQAYRRHQERVFRHFEDRPGDLLTLNICAEDARWQPICGFLGLQDPSAPFPSANKSAAVDEVLLRLLHAIGDADKVSALAGISGRYVEQLRDSQSYSDHDLEKPLASDIGWEFEVIIAKACAHLGDLDTASRKLGLPKPELADILSRNRQL